MPSAMTSACAAAASAAARSPEPRARATDEEMPPPMAPADIWPQRHLGRENQGEGCEVDDAELAHEPAVGDADQALHGHVQHVGGGQRQDGGHDRPSQHHGAAVGGTHAELGSMYPANDARAYLMRPSCLCRERATPWRIFS